MKLISRNPKWENVRNINARNPLRSMDSFPVVSAATANGIPFFILRGASIGTLLKLSPLNGSSFDERARENIIGMIERSLRLKEEMPEIDFTFSIQMVRRPISSESLERLRREDLPISMIRLNDFQKMASLLQVQETSYYLSVVATPRGNLREQLLGLSDHMRGFFNKTVRFQNEAKVFSEVLGRFKLKIQEVTSSFASVGASAILPRNVKDLLKIAREAWRPHYRGRESQEKELSPSRYRSPSDFLCRDMVVDLHDGFGVWDGCVNMVFSMDEAPNPHRPFPASEIDKILTFGNDSAALVPFISSYFVSFCSLPKKEAEKKFLLKNTSDAARVGDGKGLRENKSARIEAEQTNASFEEWLAGESDMVRGSVIYTISIPLEYVPRYFDASQGDYETMLSAMHSIATKLSGIGDSKWIPEVGNWYPIFLSSIPGTPQMTSDSLKLPKLLLTLRGVLHLSPIFTTLGPDLESFSGGNFFTTEDARLFVLDHFSKSHGEAANISICGKSGSGKSVTAQVLIMAAETYKPRIMIMDFGGGGVGSWSKFCAVSGGIELKFGAADYPIINPFQLSEADALPNRRRRREIAERLGIDTAKSREMSYIDAAYTWLRGDENNFNRSIASRLADLTEKCPPIAGKSWDEVVEIFRLGPGSCRPGEKGIAAIRMIFTCVLASSCGKDGPSDNPWATYSQDEIDDAVLRLYDGFESVNGEWPTLSDFVTVVEEINEERETEGKAPLRGYDSLIQRLRNFTKDGANPYLDGQTRTNVPLTKKVVRNGIETEEPADFILADMAGINDDRRLAIYMIVVNEFMSSILYNDPNRRGIIVRDEAWFIIGNAIASSYLAADYRLARKYGFSVITIAQQFTDFSSDVLKNNTWIWIICSLDSSAVPIADERFRFTDTERGMFLGGKDGRGQMGNQATTDPTTGQALDRFSRVFIASKAGKFFVRNKIGPVINWITTTDADETFVYNFYKKGKRHDSSALELIEWLTTGEYRNDPDLISAQKEAGVRMPRGLSI